MVTIWRGFGAVLAALTLPIAFGTGCGSSGGESGGAAPGSAVVFDIDGTLSPDAGAFFEDARPDAVRTVELLVDKGYEVVFVTARPEQLADFTRNWVVDQGFPPTRSFFAPSLADTLAPTDYKRDTLLELERTEGLDFVLGYGDSTTDFDGFGQGGVPTEGLFALLRAGAADCEPGSYAACLTGYTEHLPFIEALPPVR